MPRRFWPSAARLGAPALVLAGLLSGCAAPPPAPPAPPPAPELNLRPLSFERLEGWSEDDPREALAAFRRSCEKLPASARGPISPEPAFGDIDDWLTVCAAAEQHADPPSAAAARAFFESWFQPWQVLDGDQPEGLFTGYYEPVLNGSRRSGPFYQVPLHAPPADLLRIDLGTFNPDLAGYAIYGRVEDGQFVPYYSRAEIEHGALAGRRLELLWVDDPIAAFFLQIQGSGQIRLDDGSVVDVATVVWATGFRPDFGWVRVPGFVGDDGWPAGPRGVASAAGLYFLGIPFQYAFSSMLVAGAGRDAAFVVDRIGERVRASGAARTLAPARAIR